MNKKLKVLFLCTGNSCRSQMAEGWARYLQSDLIEPYSAGIMTHGVNPHTVKVMAEVGVDITKAQSKHLSTVMNIPFDHVVTVCSNAHESCPHFPSNAKVWHISFDDPPRLAATVTDEEQKLNCYRRVRDEIRVFIENLPEILKTRKDQH